MIRAAGLTQTYGRGAVRALAEVSFTVAQGEIAGLIGPNGAGKTTLLRILAGLLAPTAGTATVAGLPVAPGTPELKRRIGYMPELMGIYDDLKVVEYLRFFAEAYALPPRQREERLEAALELSRLAGRREAYVATLSKGMRQRLLLARTLLPDPEVLLLDEPTSGLDPLARLEWLALLRQVNESGKTILLSSHILGEVESLCGVIGILAAGRLWQDRFVPTAWVVEAVPGSGGAVIDLEVDGEPTLVRQRLAGAERVSVEERGHGRLTLHCAGPTDEAALLRRLVLDGVPVRAFQPRRASLQDRFAELVREGW